MKSIKNRTKKKFNDLDKSLMMMNFFCVALTEPICENDIKIGFFSGKWVQRAIDKGLLKKNGVTDMTTFSDTYEYCVTKKFWKLIKKKIKPISNNQLDLFFDDKLTGEE